MSTPPYEPDPLQQEKLELAGCLVFCSALLIQGLQLSSFTTSLRIAIGSAVIAVPFCSAAFLCVCNMEFMPSDHRNRYYYLLIIPGTLASVVCFVATCWHFSWLYGALAISAATAVTILGSALNFGVLKSEAKTVIKSRE